MSDYPADVILDERGDPIGRYRANQDPSDPQRFHPVPKTNANGDPIVDEKTGEPVVVLLPLDDPRALAQIAEEGYELDGTVLVAIPGNPLTDPVQEDTNE